MIGTLRLAVRFVLILLTLFPELVLSKQALTSNTYPQPLHGIDRDPFVENAPLVIAVACRDGVAIVAATEPPPPPSSNIVQQQQQEKFNRSIAMVDNEPLMYYNANEIKEMFQTCHDHEPNDDASAGNIDTNVGYPFLDLPDSFAGPYRIQSITSNDHRSATFFVSCGWKVDGYIHLRNAARDLIENEQYQFGIGNDEEMNIHLLANQLSLYMAQCAVSERVSVCRPMKLYNSPCHPFLTNLRQLRIVF
jgi:hypothetical protein